MKSILIIGPLLALFILSGCSRPEAGPRFQGRVVSHVDTYGSGTGVEANLHREGSMTSGFDYGDLAKPDWRSQIEWRFLRQDDGSDVYRVEWTFAPKNGTGLTRTSEASFDGKQSVRVAENEWQTISIEPGPLQGISQQSLGGDSGRAADGLTAAPQG